MTCKEIIDQLQDYLDGDLKDKYSKDIETHLERCFKCRKEYHSLKKLSELFRRERITLPSEDQWRKTWQNIELHISGPKSSWYREIMVILDTFAMRFFASRSLTLRFAISTGLFIVGTVLGAIYLTPSGEIYSRVVKVEHKIREVPVVEKAVQPREIVHYLANQFNNATTMVTVSEKTKPLLLAVNDTFEPAPVFAMAVDSGVQSDSSDINNPKLNIEKQIQKIQNELAPTYNRTYNPSPNRFVRFVNTAE